MSHLVVAASIDNEFQPKDISSLKQLLQAGYDIDLFYYLPKVPAEYTMIPSFNLKLKSWKVHALKILEQIGSKLNIPLNNRHLIDEILGPDEVFDQARDMDAHIILTSDKNRLKQTILTNLFDHIGHIFRRKTKDVVVENITTYTDRMVSPPYLQSKFDAAVNDPNLRAKQAAKR